MGKRKTYDLSNSRIPIFTERFRKLVDKFGGVSDVSRITGITRPTINFWYNGERTPDAGNLITLSKSLGVSTDYLLGLAGPGNATNDEKLSAASEYTGLSNTAVSRLHDLSQYDKRDTRAYSDLLSLILSDEGLEYLLGLLEGYFAEDNEITASSTSINPQDLAIFAASNEIRLMLDRIAPEFIKR